MKRLVNEVKKCPSCGKPLPAGALAGLCPACLLAQGAETEPGEPPPSHRFEPLPLEEVAKLFPQLQIISLLGAGGMGAVYKARQPALDRLVALKILPARNAHGINFAERFNREARALARLSHPNIVAIHEFGRAGELHFFIMEFVDGTNLRQLEKTGRLSAREALQIIPQICDALQYAHDEGVVHRDIKPENVLVDRKGRVKIADFGLAKILGTDGESLRLTVEGQIMGTPHYMAPEQVERPLAVDHRADIYSLGVVFYEMLTGDLPLGKFPPPSRKVQVDVRLDDVVLRALENDPARRYQKASEVKSSVETIAETPAPDTSEAVSDESAARCLRWARFPVMMERGGKRQTNWKGVVPMFLLNFGILSIAFGLVTVFTGSSLWGWLGVKGWPSVVVRLCLAALFTAFEVRRVLRLPASEESCMSSHNPQLSPRVRWWLLCGKVTVFAGLCVAAWIWFQINWLTPWLRSRFGHHAVAQVATRDAKTGNLVAPVPGGGSVELLGISDPDSAPDGWWRHDGTAVTNMTLEIGPMGGPVAPNAQLKDFVVWIGDLPEGASGPKVEFEPSSGYSGGGKVFRDGQLLSGACPYRVAFEKSARAGTLRVGFGLEPWRTIATHAPATGHNTSSTQRGDPKWTTAFNHVGEDGGDLILTMVLNHGEKNWNMRVIAVDSAGVEHKYTRAMSTPAEKIATWTYTFVGLTKDRVKEFQVQVQRLHWVEFRNIALQPDTPLPRLKPAAFGPVQEITFDELIDFDTGKTSEFPKGDGAGNFFDGIGRNLGFMQQNGYDAEAGIGELNTLGMTIVELTNVDWNTLRPDALLLQLQERGSFPSELKPTAGKLPTTYGFRTREGGIGILQLVRFEDGRSSVTLRFKSVEGPASLPRSPVSIEDIDLRAAQKRLENLLERYTEAHPEVQAVRARITELRRMTREEPGAPADLRAAKALLAELRTRYTEAHPQVQQTIARIRALETK